MSESEILVFGGWYLVVGLFFGVAIIHRDRHSLAWYLLCLAGMAVGWFWFVSGVMIYSVLGGGRE